MKNIRMIIALSLFILPSFLGCGPDKMEIEILVKPQTVEDPLTFNNVNFVQTGSVEGLHSKTEYVTNEGTIYSFSVVPDAREKLYHVVVDFVGSDEIIYSETFEVEIKKLGDWSWQTPIAIASESINSESFMMLEVLSDPNAFQAKYRTEQNLAEIRGKNVSFLRFRKHQGR